MSQIVSPIKDILKPSPPVPQNVTSLGNGLVADAVSWAEVTLEQGGLLSQRTAWLYEDGRVRTQGGQCGKMRLHRQARSPGRVAVSRRCKRRGTARPQPSEGVGPAHPWLSGFWPPEPRDDTCLLL